MTATTPARWERVPQRLIALVFFAGLTATASPLAAQQQQLSRPFEIAAGERATFALGISEPGPIEARVTVQGGPVRLQLLRPDGRVALEQQGSGALSLSAQVTPEDVQRGILWMLVVASGATGVTSRTGGATGTVVATYPKVAAPVLNAALAAADARSRELPTVATPDTAATLRVARQQLQSQVVARQQAALQQLTARVQGQVMQPSGATVATMRPGVTMGSARVGMAVPAQTAPATVQKSGGPPGTTTPPTGGAGAPIMTRLSVAQGDPGTPVLIDGANFGDTKGEVHFVIGMNRDVAATSILHWSGTQILTAVPDASGLPQFGGFVYVQRADGSRTALQPFTFVPATDVVRLCASKMPQNLRVTQPGQAGGLGIDHPMSAVFGTAGYDELMPSQPLRNGWVVESVTTVDLLCGTGIPEITGSTIFSKAGGAYVVDSRVGTNMPYVKVRYWMDAFTSIRYDIAITIRGPKGLPY